MSLVEIAPTALLGSHILINLRYLTPQSLGCTCTTFYTIKVGKQLSHKEQRRTDTSIVGLRQGFTKNSSQDIANTSNMMEQRGADRLMICSRNCHEGIDDFASDLASIGD